MCELSYPAACGILLPRPGIEPSTLALEVPSPDHWTAREVPAFVLTAGFLYLMRHRGDTPCLCDESQLRATRTETMTPQAVQWLGL